MTKPEIRYATHDDLAAFYGLPLPFPVSVRAIAVELDGQIVAIAGLALYPESSTAFSEMRDELRPYKKTIMRTGRMFMDLVRKHGYNVAAFASPDEPNSLAFLQRLGFTHCGERLCRV